MRVGQLIVKAWMASVLLGMIVTACGGNETAGKTDPTATGTLAEVTRTTEAAQEQLTPTARLSTAVPATPLPTATESKPTHVVQVSTHDGMNQVYIPAGDFLMGASEDQFAQVVAPCVEWGDQQDVCESWYEDEIPQHTVYLDAFWMDQTEVTNAQYALCVDTRTCKAPYDVQLKYDKGEYFGNPLYADYPVREVDWNMARAYCTWVGRRLPTEAEWEKAARGTDGRTYPWGEGVDESKANYGRNTGDTGSTSRVGSYPAGASPYGVLDMAGNVMEWVADWYAEDYYQTQTTWQNPTGPGQGIYRVKRDGPWMFGEELIRTTGRSQTKPAGRDSSLGEGTGFRCAESQP